MSSPSKAAFGAKEKTGEPFRFHLFTEPHTSDPVDSDGPDSSYLLSALYHGLFVYDNAKGVVPQQAQSCERIDSLKMICTLRKNLKWSDGSPLKAEDYVKSFRRILSLKSKSREVNLLFSLKNARKIFTSTLPEAELGMRALDDFRIEFTFEKPDLDFESKLTSPLLVPYRVPAEPNRPETGFFNGPYKIAKWSRGKKIHLLPNPFFKEYEKPQPSHSERPDVEIYFIEEDSTALALYETSGLDFLRRLVSSLIPTYRQRKDFLQLPVARFDYIGFGPELQKDLFLRKALSLGVDYEQFKKVFYAKGRPGCPGIPENYLEKIPCLNFDLNKAKEALAKSAQPISNRKLKFYFSKTGGDDIRRVAEFYQGQWKKNLGIEVELLSMENKTYIPFLKETPPDLFRKGFALDRPSCAAALEAFRSDAAENYIRLKSAKFDQMFESLENTIPNPQKKTICSNLVSFLIENYFIIPQGRIHFSILASPRFAGWKLNEFNELDLTELHQQK